MLRYLPGRDDECRPEFGLPEDGLGSRLKLLLLLLRLFLPVSLSPFEERGGALGADCLGEGFRLFPLPLDNSSVLPVGLLSVLELLRFSEL